MEAPQHARKRSAMTRWLSALLSFGSKRNAGLFLASQWRGILFGALGAYALGAAVFLLAGGARPAMTSLVAMEAEVETGEAVSELPPDCNDIDPVEHTVNPGLGGVHALGFVTLEERAASFAGYAGCPLIVNFFASWCVPCVTEMPDFERFWNAHGATVAVLGLAANDRLEDAIETVEERGVTYPTGLDEGELFIDFGGLGMPTTVFISPEGEILETHSGLLTLDDITNRAMEHFGL